MKHNSTDSDRKNADSSECSAASSDPLHVEPTQRLRAVIADDDPVILREVARLLEKRFEVVARAANGRELVEAVRRFSPTVVVADVTMPEMNGIEAVRQIHETSPGVRVVMLSVHDDPAFVEAAFSAGASGYVLKLAASLELNRAIDEVLAGRLYSSGQAA